MPSRTDDTWARGYRDLDVYQRAMAVLRPLHDLALTFPDYEKFDLASQMRRAAKSVPTNIAEGYARKKSAKDFVQYLTFAMGSANEMEVHFDVAFELGYVTDQQRSDFTGTYQVIGKQLRRLIEHWRSVSPTASHQRPVASDQ